MPLVKDLFKNDLLADMAALPAEAGLRQSEDKRQKKAWRSHAKIRPLSMAYTVSSRSTP